MRRVKASLIIHIGQHKTGSKALQSFLAHNRQTLLEEGILYPVEDNPGHDIQAYSLSQFRLFVLTRREAIGACMGQAAEDHYWRRISLFCRPFETTRSLFEAIEAEHRRGGLTHVVLSAEDLFDMQTAHELEFSPELVKAAACRLAGLASDFAYDPRIVVYLRRQDHLLGAHYGQFIKGSPVHDIDFEEFSRAFAPRLDFRNILAVWTAAFGKDRICVRPYEREALPGGIVPDFFQHVLGRPVPTGCVEPPTDAESVNRSLGRDFVEYIRILNRRNALLLPVFPREVVLEAALHEASSSERPASIAGWLSPAARRDLIAAFSEGNFAIGCDFLQRDDGRLFAEPLPDENENWSPYPGLTPEKATAISLEIHEIILARCPSTQAPPKCDPKKRLRSIALRLFSR